MAEELDSKIRVLPTPEDDVRTTLENALKISDGLDGVIIVGTRKDGGQLIRTSSITNMHKAYMIAFL